MSEEVKKSEDYKCPNCGSWTSEGSHMVSTPSEFQHEPDPHYSWIEVHRCKKCETIYQFRNST